jgi:hypothetical protein
MLFDYQLKAAYNKKIAALILLGAMYRPCHFSVTPVDKGLVLHVVACN